MSDIDERIRGALDADDKAFLESLDDEPGIFRQIRNTFKGSLGWLVVTVNVLIIAVSAAGIYAIWGFLHAEGAASLIRWAAFGWAAWTVQIALKNWMWDRMHMLNVLRELKRLELQVAMLAEKRA